MIEKIKAMRDNLMQVHGIGTSIWNQMFTYSFMGSVFCPENRESIIKMYDDLQVFVGLAQKHGVRYYMGIDEFLHIYGTNEWFQECRDEYYREIAELKKKLEYHAAHAGERIINGMYESEFDAACRFHQAAIRH